MQISSLYDTESGVWKRQLDGLLLFIREHGDIRIVMSVCKNLSCLTPSQLSLPGISLLVATVRGQQGRQVSGLSIAVDYGKEIFFVAVHPLYRNRGVGTLLLTEQVKRLGSLQCQVESTHAASLKMCFKAGLVAVDLVNGPGEQPDLLLRTLPMKDTATETEFITSQEGDLLCRNPS
ncbi:GNAT family N-acetyltransferase [Paenibacillus sp. sgz500958]|uniref:GNAT family N-acetyltransferase n=1 Tax=Paenibacillus sp. sgz500958 TaxID=3242475 RepID=UPI0036D30DC7